MVFLLKPLVPCSVLIPFLSKKISSLLLKKEDGLNGFLWPETLHEQNIPGITCATGRVLGVESSPLFLDLFPMSCLHWWRKPQVWTALVPKEEERGFVVDLHNARKT